MAKEAKNIPTYNKEARPTSGKETSPHAFGIGRFGTAKFGHSTGFQTPKEALPSKISSS